LHKVIICGGGTGGHIFPAIAIANGLKATNENIEILFIGAQDRMEMEKVPQAGYKIEGLWISGLQRSLSARNLSFPFKLLQSMVKSKRIIKKFNPEVIIGVGGYSSGPVMYNGYKMGIPTLIQEQNSFPGITNRLMAKKVNKICVAYDHMQKFFPEDKTILTGNPIREEIKNSGGKREEAIAHFGLNAEKPTILVIGGSLGAATINKSIVELLNNNDKNDFQLLWQTGSNYYDEIVSGLSENENRAICHRFIDRMDLAYAAANIVVSRAGAISISELCVAGKATILVPSPNVAEDHQTKNALALENVGSAIMIKDKDAIEQMGKVVMELISNSDKIDDLERNIVKMAKPNATDEIVKEIMNLIED